MQHLKKCFILSAVIMLIQTIAYREFTYDTMSNFILSRINFREHYITSGDIVLLAMDMFPVIVFEVVYGIYIYRRFCTASVYYFSRQDNRLSWYGCECLKLFGYTVMFFGSYAIFHIIYGTSVMGIKMDSNGFYTLCCCLMMQIMYTFIFVFWINMLSILFGGQNATVLIMGIQYAFVFLLQVAEYEKKVTDVYSWKLYLNPFANVVAAWHSDIPQGNLLETKFTTSHSVIYFSFILIVSVIVGGICIKNMDIALENKEELG